MTEKYAIITIRSIIVALALIRPGGVPENAIKGVQKRYVKRSLPAIPITNVKGLHAIRCGTVPGQVCDGKVGILRGKFGGNMV